MSEVLDIDSLPWEAVRPGVATGVQGRTLLSDGVKIVFTRVAPGGGFAPHRDAYGHLLHVLSGRGVVGVAGREYPAAPGVVVRIDAGEEHHYRNTGSDDLTLISVNIPESRS